MMAAETPAERVTEFRRNVWDHTVDPFQLRFDTPPPLSEDDLRALESLVNSLSVGESDEQVAAELLAEVRARPEFILTVLQAIGSTRNKILTDLRAATAGQNLRIPGSPTSLHRNERVWQAAGLYIAVRFRQIFSPLIPLTSGRNYALETLNRATWPGWIRQERAKRQGHEAENRLAVLCVALDIPFDPVGKAENPLTQDAQISGVSFDLVIPSRDEPLVCVKSTLHSSNIGQYGTSKDLLEVRQAAAVLAENFPANPPTLLAMIDGVGCLSNRVGLEGILTAANEFCQFKTLWKAAALAAQRLNLEITVALPEEHLATHRAFLARCGDTVRVRPLTEQAALDAPGWVQAGEGFIVRGHR